MYKLLLPLLLFYFNYTAEFKSQEVYLDCFPSYVFLFRLKTYILMTGPDNDLELLSMREKKFYQVKFTSQIFVIRLVYFGGRNWELSLLTTWQFGFKSV